HLDFSILNVGITGPRGAERLQIFDPHMGVIEVSRGGREVQDPLATCPSEHRSIEELLRAARDGSRWALWRIQQDAIACPDVSQESAGRAAALVREFHVASSAIGKGHGPFSLSRFDQTWQQRGAHGLNPVLHVELWTLLQHPLCGLLYSMLEASTPDEV